MLEYFIGAVYTLVSPVMDGIQLNDSYGLKNMKLWEQIKKIKNKFWIVVNILFIALMIYVIYDMYYYFDQWGSDAFPGKEYQSKEIYVQYSTLGVVIYLILFLTTVALQKKFPRICKFLLMTPLWLLGFGLISSILPEMSILD